MTGFLRLRRWRGGRPKALMLFSILAGSVSAGHTLRARFSNGKSQRVRKQSVDRRVALDLRWCNLQRPIQHRCRNSKLAIVAVTALHPVIREGDLRKVPVSVHRGRTHLQFLVANMLSPMPASIFSLPYLTGLGSWSPRLET